MNIRNIALTAAIAISPAIALADQTATLYLPSVHTGEATVVLLPNVRLPKSSAIVTVYGHPPNGAQQRLATLYLAGSSQLSGERIQTLRATIRAQSATVHALLTGGSIITVACPSAGGPCLTTGPAAVSVGSLH